MKMKLKSTLILSIVIVMSVVSGCAVHNNNSVPEITTTTTSTESTTVKPEDTTTTPEGTNEPTVESEATTSQPEETTSTVTSEPETTTQATTTTPETVKPETTTSKPETTTSKPESKPQTTTTTPKPEISKPAEVKPHTHNYVLVSVIEEPIHTATHQEVGTGIYECEICGLTTVKSVKPACEYVNDRCTVCNKLHPDHIHEWKDYEWTEEVESYESINVYECRCNKHFYTSAELDAHQATTGFDGTCLDCGYYIEKCGDHKEYNPDNPKLWRCICPACGGHNLERYAACDGWRNTLEVRAITEEVTHHGKKCICGETQQID